MRCIKRKRWRTKISRETAHLSSSDTLTCAQAEAKKKAADDKTRERMEKLNKAQDEKVQASAANAAAQLAFGSNARWNRWGAKKDPAAKPDAAAPSAAAAGSTAGPAEASALASAAAAPAASAAAPGAAKADGSAGERLLCSRAHSQNKDQGIAKLALVHGLKQG